MPMPIPEPGVRALLSLWNDVAPERAAEYERWHTIEHVPERVWVPGMVSGIRYVREGGGLARYFTLYELESLDVLESSAYGELVAHPTPWSASMRPSFSGFLRKTGQVAAEAGQVLGRTLCVVRLVWRDAAVPGTAQWQAVAAALMRQPAQLVCRVRVQAVLPAGPQALKNEDEAPSDGSEFIVLADHAGDEALAADDAVRAVEAALGAAGAAAPSWHAGGVYRLVSLVRHEDVAAPRRPKPRTDLMP